MRLGDLAFMFLMNFVSFVFAHAGIVSACGWVFTGFIAFAGSDCFLTMCTWEDCSKSVRAVLIWMVKTSLLIWLFRSGLKQLFMAASTELPIYSSVIYILVFCFFVRSGFDCDS